MANWDTGEKNVAAHRSHRLVALQRPNLGNSSVRSASREETLKWLTLHYGNIKSPAVKLSSLTTNTTNTAKEKAVGDDVSPSVAGDDVSPNAAGEAAISMAKGDLSDKVSSKSVKGRVKENSAYWALIGADHFILDMIVSGYKIPFYTVPDPVEIKNNKTSLNNQDFVSDEILSLIEKGCVVCVVSYKKPTVVNPLSVGNKTGR